MNATAGRKEVALYAPLPHQVEDIEAEHRYKLWREGRRRGKSRKALLCCVIGHGPRDPQTNEPMWLGMMHGLPILWVARDIPQARAIWREEILPRFAGVDGVELNETEKRVTLQGGGSLEIRSNENINSVRGRKFGGVVFDEGAWFDLEYAWHEVVRASLADLRGWAIFASTPNFGKDGNHGRPQGPSYFNILCQQEIAGELTVDWGQTHGTTRDNPVLDRSEVDDLYREYENRPAARDQELDAKLLEGVEGVAFPEFRKDVHVVEVKVPEGAWWGGGLDWGYSSPGWLGIRAFWHGLHGVRTHLVREVEFQKEEPYTAGYNAGKKILDLPVPQFIAADLEMWATGDGRGGVRVSLAEEFQRGLDDAMGASRSAKLIPAAKGPQSRLVRKIATHAILKYTAEPDGTIKPWNQPEGTIDPSCTHYIRCMETLPLDPDDPEKAATDNVYDHPYDGDSYLLITRHPEGEKVEHKARSEDRHPGDKKFLKQEPEAPRRRFSQFGRRD